MQERSLTIRNRRGLHARAAAKFVRLMQDFNAEIRVAKDEIEVSGRSIMGLMMLAAAQGSSIKVTALGPQGPEAMAAIAALIERRFDEED